MNEKETNFTAANAVPMKLFKDSELVELINKENKIVPRHVQIAPTNKCNLHCEFCSCDAVDKKQQLSKEDMYDLVDIIKKEGCRGVTITGGGEPTLYPYINEMIYELNDAGIKMGLVSNGIQVKNIEPEAVDKLTWARISFSDDRKFNSYFKDAMSYLRQHKNLDLAYSYVLTTDSCPDKVKDIIEHANENDFTHVRIVDNIYDPSPRRMRFIKNYMDFNNVNVDKTIFQERSEYTCGDKDCNISLLKPLVAPDGYVYPCCGVQYALPKNQKKFPKEMRMGHFRELSDIIENQENFNGSKCTKCYYQNYNTFLKGMKGDYEHKEFI